MKKSLDLLIILLFLLEINSKFPNISQHIRKPIRKRNKIFFNFTSFCPNGYYKDINGNLRCNHITNKYCTNFLCKIWNKIKLIPNFSSIYSWINSINFNGFNLLYKNFFSENFFKTNNNPIDSSHKSNFKLSSGSYIKCHKGKLGNHFCYFKRIPPDSLSNSSKLICPSGTNIICKKSTFKTLYFCKKLKNLRF